MVVQHLSFVTCQLSPVNSVILIEDVYINPLTFFVFLQVKLVALVNANVIYFTSFIQL